MFEKMLIHLPEWPHGMVVGIGNVPKVFMSAVEIIVRKQKEAPRLDTIVKLLQPSIPVLHMRDHVEGCDCVKLLRRWHT